MSLIVWIPLFPFVGFLINFVGGCKFKKGVSETIACSSIFLSFAVSVFYFLNLMVSGEFTGIREYLFTWIQTEDLSIGFSLVFDRISGLMTLIITGISFLIHLYSVGYMARDKRQFLFFAYLNLFVFFMLILVLSDNLLLLFVGWEGVGLCSYLLIGYYNEKKSACTAAKKAFIMNRLGDFGILIGILLSTVLFGTLNFYELNEVVPLALQTGAVSLTTVTLLCLLFFFGAAGKSAQIPLFTWLPDAMEGPTPVSALIHAATMVTSGVYLMARLSSLFLLSPFAQGVIATVGALTAVVAALIAVSQTDIKKVLAYSTVSQLGFMFIAMGTGAFVVGMFHLMTHAFFKALLFLGAGSVINSMHHEQDLRKMGGLKKSLPITYLTFSVGAYSLAGLPLGAGFFSKDEILWNSLFSPHGSFLLTGIGWFASFLTAFYIYRLINMAFGGVAVNLKQKVKESSRIMLIPLIILAGFSAFIGFLGIPHALDFLHIGNLFEEFLISAVRVDFRIKQPVEIEFLIIGISTAVAFLGFFAAKLVPKFFETSSSQNTWKKFFENRFYWDEFYEIIFVKPFFWLTCQILNGFEKATIESIGKIAQKTQNFGNFSAKLQNGSVRFYFYVFAISLIVFLYFY